MSFFLFIGLFFFPNLAFAKKKNRTYINYILINTGIDNQLDEHKRQVDMRDNQIVVNGAEHLNKEQTTKFKQLYEKARSRLNSLNLIIDAYIISSQAVPSVRGIAQNQEEVYKLCKEMPILIPFAIKSEYEFVDKSQMILRYLTGIALTYGDINQMKPSDRKMLLNHAIDELNTLYGISDNLVMVLRNIRDSIKLTMGEWQSWVNRDKDIMKQIIINANNF